MKKEKHKKAGRPFVYGNEGNTLMPTLRIEKKLADEIKEQSKSTHISIAELRRMAYREKFTVDKK